MASQATPSGLSCPVGISAASAEIKGDAVKNMKKKADMHFAKVLSNKVFMIVLSELIVVTIASIRV